MSSAVPCSTCGEPLALGLKGHEEEGYCRTCQHFKVLPLLDDDDEPESAQDAPEPASGPRQQGKADKPPEPESVAVLVRLADVQPEAVRWLWPGRIPLGKVTVVAGPPGVGKSTALLDVAARVTRGSMLPDGGAAPLGDVVLLTAEDGLADTVRPRLDLAGADTSRVHALTMIRKGDSERLFSLEEHLLLLERAINERGAGLAIIDPLLAFSGRADSYKDAEVRGLLAPLAAMAERTGCAVVGVLHLNKRGGERSPLNRITGSIAFVAAARSVLLMAVDPDDDSGHRRVLAPVKMNLCSPPASLGLHFAEDGGLVWDGPVSKGAEALLALPLEDGERGALVEAQDFLRDLLAEKPVEAKQVRKEAADAGVAPRTLDRAKASLSVKSERQGGLAGEGRWAWRLPKDATPPIYVGVASLENLDRAEPGLGDLRGGVEPPDPAQCNHRPAGETDRKWQQVTGDDDPHTCRCCGGPVRKDLWTDNLCPVCRNGWPAKEGSGHLVRGALDMGATVVEGSHAD